ncbi:MAG: class I tRNA ligase family protein, partial [Thermoproteota archaeon]|nr:class I tRNA ligase family protein [Thermoproteota archaeon]
MRVFNTLSKKDQLFRISNRHTLHKTEKQFKIFVCGPTVYDYCHLGHARIILFYDLVARFLRYTGSNVVFVMNVTDVDPKVSARAKRYGVSPEKVSDKFFHQLFTDLSLLDVTGLSLARVSDYVAEARQLASDLLKKGAAYSLSANIYLDTAKIKAFGQMSGMSRSRLNDMRLDLATNKRSPADILLWNTSDDIGYTYKDKTLGEGFPTVHLQDLSVIMALYAGTYHIHGGATDLVYPHHETLLGQLIALTSLRRPVKCWTHVGLLMNKGSKMSNSLGNAIQIRRIHRRYGRNI